MRYICLIMLVCAVSACGGKKTCNVYQPLPVSQRDKVIESLQDKGIQFINYGDIKTVIIPTDEYFIPQTTDIRPDMKPYLDEVVRLVNSYPDTYINVAGFTDDFYPDAYEIRFSRERAKTITGLLWASGIELNRLHARGYGKYFDVADNKSIIGSSMNRRIEIQWREVYA